MSDLIPADFCAETIALKKTLESGFIVLGERLNRIKREQMWQSHWDSFAGFCHEMDINEATASRLITVYRTYIEDYKLTQDDLSGKSWYNLYQLRGLIPEKATPKQVRELVETSSDLSREDIKKMVREDKHGVCKHDFYELRIRQCRECGHREAID